MKKLKHLNPTNPPKTMNGLMRKNEESQSGAQSLLEGATELLSVHSCIATLTFD